MHRVDTPGATVDKRFQSENPGLGIQATELGADWHNAVQEEIAGVIEAAGIVLDKSSNNQLFWAIMLLTSRDSVIVQDGTTLTSGHGIVFINPAEGVTVVVNLPVYATVAAQKGYRLKNIGEGLAQVATTDGKTIDGAATLDLAPGDRCELVKDGTNWQTI